MAPVKVWSTSCGARAPPMQDPRIVTLLFTDVEGSTRLLGSLGDAFVAVIERQRAILTDAARCPQGQRISHRVRRLRLHLRVGRRRGGGSRRGPARPGGRAVAGRDLRPGPDGDSRRRGRRGGRRAVRHGPPSGVPDPRRHARRAGRRLGRGGRAHRAARAGHLAARPGRAPAARHRPAGSAPPGRRRGHRDVVPAPEAPRRAARAICRRRRPRSWGASGSCASWSISSRPGGSSRSPAPAAPARPAWRWRSPGGSRSGIATACAWSSWRASAPTRWCPRPCSGRSACASPRPGRSATEFLCAALADRDLLLVLDNCEHVVAGVAALVSELLPACAPLHVLATSREPLRLPGEVERPVPPLDRPDPDALESLERLAEYDAVRLLVERGGDVRPGFRLTDGNAAAVARICSELAGLPLAIELAAARLRTLSPEQVAARLGEQLDLLTHGGRSRPDRQQTMRATLDWSHQLLAARRADRLPAALGLRGWLHARRRRAGRRGRRRRSRRGGRRGRAPGQPVAGRGRPRPRRAAAAHARAGPPVRGRTAARGRRARPGRAATSGVGGVVGGEGRDRVHARAAPLERAAPRRAGQHPPGDGERAGRSRSRGGAAHRRRARLPVVHDGAAGRARVGRARARGGPRSTRSDSGHGAVRGGDAGRECARLRPGARAPAEGARHLQGGRCTRVGGVGLDGHGTCRLGHRCRCAAGRGLVRGRLADLPRGR